MPHQKSTDSFTMAERIQVDIWLGFTQDVYRSINSSSYSSYYSRVKEIN